MQAQWLEDGTEISAARLDAEGIHTRALPLTTAEHQPYLDELRAARGYTTQDEIALSPKTEGLGEICAKFAHEHLHIDDEVRFVLEGEGVFDIRSQDDRWMRVRVEAGDLIVVPANRHHRFELTELRTIRCVRLFQDPAGWTPVYRR